MASRTWLITGVSSGVGRELTEQLLERGDRVVGTVRDTCKVKDLLTFAMLISLGGCEPQAKGHVAANLNPGNGRDVLPAVITHLLPFIGYPRSLNALRVLNEVTAQ